MKRIILAATIAASTLAGAAYGEVLEIQCTWGTYPNTEETTYQFDMDQKTAFEVGTPDDEEFRVIIWNDSFIAWNHLMINGPHPAIGTYMIDRNTLKLQVAWMMLGLPEFTDPAEVQCVRPL